ncbi:lytic exoenzyme target recognition domain-containing protein [Leuconostoc sp.]
MAYEIKQDIVVPNNYVKSQMGLVPPFRQIHNHSTGNPRSTVQNERDYLAGHYPGANYTHLVGVTNGQVDIRQVMNTNGGAYDVGGDWNWETWAAIELVEGSIKTREDFNIAYPAYIWLTRELARQAGIPITIDTPDISGIKTHNYASKTGHGSDHVDPIGFLASWGVSYNQFKNDILNGIGENDNVVITPAQQAPTPAPQQQTTNAIQQFKNNGNRFTAFKTFRVDEIKKVNGIWQVANYWLAGGKDGFDWTLNGIPWAVLDNTTRSNAVNIQVGDMVKFDENNNSGTIDKYDPASNGVGIIFGKYGIIWFDADAFLVL